jgi:hypothetical protein
MLLCLEMAGQVPDDHDALLVDWMVCSRTMADSTDKGNKKLNITYDITIGRK